MNIVLVAGSIQREQKIVLAVVRVHRTHATRKQLLHRFLHRSDEIVDRSNPPQGPTGAQEGGVVISRAQRLVVFHIVAGVAVCCSVLQCVAVCCSVLQCVAMWEA